MKTLTAIYWLNSLSALAWSLIGVFIPIYLLTLGYPLKIIFVFYMLDSLVVFLSGAAAVFISARIGLKKTLLLYLPFLAAFLVSLYFVNEFAGLIWLVAVFSAAQTAFYFMPINIIFARSATAEKMGDSVGKMSAYPQIASLAAPLIGGAVAFVGGFAALIALSGAIFIVAAIWLFFIQDEQPKIEFGAAKILQYFKNYSRYALVQICQFFQQTLESVIWPIFIYLTFGSILSVGFAGALLGLGSFFFTLFVGKRADIQSKRTLFKIGAGAMLGVWIVRFFFHDEIIYYAITVCAGFLGILVAVPFNAMTFNISKRNNTAEFLLFREFTLLISRLTAFGLAFFLADQLDYIFIAAAFSSLIFFLI